MRAPIATWTFVLAVVQKGDRFLMVQERKHGNTWYLPAGRVEPGETLHTAVLRETMEEGGIPIVLTGLFRIERQVEEGGAWQRFCYLAIPKDDRPPKSVEDKESLGAAWKTAAEIEQLPLRGGNEVIELIRLVQGASTRSLLDLLFDA